MQTSTNGCLGRVTGPELGAAKQLLPKPTRDSLPSMSVDTDAMMLGRVRVTFELRINDMHRWSIQHFWQPVHAEVISTLKPEEVKDEMLARWLRWSEDRLEEGDIPTRDTAVRLFYEALLRDCPMKIHALGTHPVEQLKAWITEDALP